MSSVILLIWVSEFRQKTFLGGVVRIPSVVVIFPYREWLAFMMVSGHLASEFKVKAVRQVFERGYSVAEIAARLGVSTHSQMGKDCHLGRFCAANNLEPSVSRRGNFWDNAGIESIFGSLKNKRIRKRIYKTRVMARADFLTISRSSTTEPAAIATWAVLVPRLFKAPRYETGKCLSEWGWSSRISILPGTSRHE